MGLTTGIESPETERVSVAPLVLPGVYFFDPQGYNRVRAS